MTGLAVSETAKWSWCRCLLLSHAYLPSWFHFWAALGCRCRLVSQPCLPSWLLSAALGCRCRLVSQACLPSWFPFWVALGCRCRLVSQACLQTCLPSWFPFYSWLPLPPCLPSLSPFMISRCSWLLLLPCLPPCIYPFMFSPLGWIRKCSHTIGSSGSETIKGNKPRDKAAAAAKSRPKGKSRAAQNGDKFGDKLGRQGGSGIQEQPRMEIIKGDKLGRQGSSVCQEQPMIMKRDQFWTQGSSSITTIWRIGGSATQPFRGQNLYSFQLSERKKRQKLYPFANINGLNDDRAISK